MPSSSFTKPPAVSLSQIVGSGACTACRARITKCSSERPQCHECRRRQTPCVYPDTRPDRALTKRRSGRLQAQSSSALEYIYRLLQSQPENAALEILHRIRRGADVHAILRFVEYGNLRQELSLVPDVSFQFTSPYLADMLPIIQGPDNPYLTSKLYTALGTSALQGSDTYWPVREPIYHIPFTGARVYDTRISPASLKPSRWTSVSSDDTFLTSLLEVYFLYEFPLWPCVHKDVFLDDMIAGRKDYCSSFLVNVILAAACHGLSGLNHRCEFWNPKTFGYRFMVESKKLWEQESTQAPCLTTAQAATILGRIYFANGMDNVGWEVWTQALDIAEKLDLFSGNPQNLGGKEHVSRMITAWGFFSQQSFSCFYLMKPPLARHPPLDGLPDYQNAANFFGEIWIKYPLAQHLVPMHLGHTFLALIRLRCIMNDIAAIALPGEGGHNNLTLEQAMHFNSMLANWRRELPEALQPKNIALPTHLQLHMQYHNLVTMTFLPFLRSETTMNKLGHTGSYQDTMGFSPARLVASSRVCLETLLHMFYHRHGFDAYYIFLLQALVQLGFDAMRRLRKPNAHEEYSPAAIKAIRATLILCAKGLRDQGRNFYLSECVFRILRDEMSDADVKILDNWAHIKNEEQRERLMTEHVQGEYPVDIEHISEQPNDRRLHRLLASMGDLKLPGDESETERIENEERAARTWRSIVF